MPKNPSSISFSYVDLFAGCGGLSVGLESQGGKLIFALERSPMAAETFMRNLITPEMTDLEWQKFLSADINKQLDNHLLVKDINDIASSPEVTNSLNKLDVDLVAGGPPCQGFSMAGRRKHDDLRNNLPWKFLEIVDAADPKIVIIENVLGMNQRFSSQGEDSTSAFAQVAEALESTGRGYIVQKLLLNAKHFGAAQNRPRLFLIGLRSDLAEKTGITASRTIWKSDFQDKISAPPTLAPAPTLNSAEERTVEQALAGFIPGGRPTSGYVAELADAEFWGIPSVAAPANTNRRTHGERATLKFELYLALNRLNLPSVLMRDGLSPSKESLRQEYRSHLKDLSYPILKTTGAVLASSAEQFWTEIERHKTKKHSQRVLQAKTAAPTVITSPDDYIHPTEPRVLSVRELARFQGFPEAFTFRAKETTGGMKRAVEVPQYSQVGNAVSPYVGRALGVLVKRILALTANAIEG